MRAILPKHHSVATQDLHVLTGVPPRRHPGRKIKSDKCQGCVKYKKKVKTNYCRYLISAIFGKVQLHVINAVSGGGLARSES